MPLNKDHPLVYELAADCILYGREVKLNEHNLRLVRMIIFDRPATKESLLDAYQKKDLPMDMADSSLEWLMDNHVVELKPDNTFVLTNSFVCLMKEIHPFLLD